MSHTRSCPEKPLTPKCVDHLTFMTLLHSRLNLLAHSKPARYATLLYAHNILTRDQTEHRNVDKYDFLAEFYSSSQQAISRSSVADIIYGCGIFLQYGMLTNQPVNSLLVHLGGLYKALLCIRDSEPTLVAALDFQLVQAICVTVNEQCLRKSLPGRPSAQEDVGELYGKMRLTASFEGLEVIRLIFAIQPKPIPAASLRLQYTLIQFNFQKSMLSLVCKYFDDEQQREKGQVQETFLDSLKYFIHVISTMILDLEAPKRIIEELLPQVEFPADNSTVEKWDVGADDLRIVVVFALTRLVNDILFDKNSVISNPASIQSARFLCKVISLTTTTWEQKGVIFGILLAGIVLRESHPDSNLLSQYILMVSLRLVCRQNDPMLSQVPRGRPFSRGKRCQRADPSGVYISVQPWTVVR